MLIDNLPPGDVKHRLFVGWVSITTLGPERLLADWGGLVHHRFKDLRPGRSRFSAITIVAIFRDQPDLINGRGLIQGTLMYIKAKLGQENLIKMVR